MNGDTTVIINTLTQVIGSLGFPIVMCFYMMKQNREMNKDHKEEVSHLREAVENNTLTMQKIFDKLEEM
jgi:hypothetical protein